VAESFGFKTARCLFFVVFPEELAFALNVALRLLLTELPDFFSDVDLLSRVLLSALVVLTSSDSSTGKNGTSCANFAGLGDSPDFGNGCERSSR
jgi:hypothetical protein